MRGFISQFKCRRLCDGSHGFLAAGGYGIRLLLCLILVAFILVPAILMASGQIKAWRKNVLTQEERQWLSKHEDTIRIGITEIPPQVLRGKTARNYEGLSVDYLKLIENTLGCKFRLVYLETWKQVMQAARDKSIDMIFAAQKNPERSEYLLFSKSYIELPNMIVVRKNMKGVFTLDDVKGLKIVCSDGSAVQEYFKNNYGYLDLYPVKDELSGLIKVSFAEADAMVVEISRASYYTEKAKITNLRVAGSAGYQYELRFASRKDWPILKQILDKGLSPITSEDRDRIARKWTSIGAEKIFANKHLWLAFATVLSILALIFLGIMSWNLALKAKVEERTVQLQQELLERKKAQAELKRTNDYLENVLENSPDVISIVDKDGKFLKWNRMAAEQYGYTAEELRGKSAFDLYADKDELHGMLAELRRKGTVKKYPIRMKKKDGTTAIFELSISLLKDDARNILGSVCVARDSSEIRKALADLKASNEQLNRDIIERKQAQEALRESEIRFATVFRLSPICTSLTRLSDGRFLDVNDEFLKLFGYEREDVTGRNPLMLNMWVNPEDRERMVETLHAQGRVKGFETTFRTKTGEVKNVIVIAETIEVAGEWYILGLSRDITERKRAEKERERLEAQLRQAQKMEAVGRLAGGVAHDFNNMLAVILGYTEMALAGLKPIDPIHAHLTSVQAAAKRSADLTRQLLAFSRKQTIAPRVLNLNEQTKAMERLLGRIIGEDIDLVFKLSSGLKHVYLDPAQVDQILANLAVNSRDAMPEGGKLTVETTNITFDEAFCERHLGFTPGDFVMLAVSDTGCGMDRETLEHVFEPFFTTKPEGKGTGLGLATVYGIVKQNNGFVDVYSEPGHGTTVKVYIPQYKGEEEVVPVKIEEGRPAGGWETVLLVEDENQMRHLAKNILERLHYRVLEASSPGEAVAICEKYAGKIHLLLTDVVMPTMNGKELESRIKVMKPGIRTLFMSGYTADAIAHRGVLEKGAQFLQKPFSIDAIAKKVREVLTTPL